MKMSSCNKNISYPILWPNVFLSKKNNIHHLKRDLSMEKDTSIDPRRFWIPCLRYFCHLNFRLSFGLHLRCGLGLLPTKEGGLHQPSGGLHGWRISWVGGPAWEGEKWCVCVCEKWQNYKTGLSVGGLAHVKDLGEINKSNKGWYMWWEQNMYQHDILGKLSDGAFISSLFKLFLIRRSTNS